MTAWPRCVLVVGEVLSAASGLRAFAAASEWERPEPWRATADLLPLEALAPGRSTHPLADRIAAFLGRQYDAPPEPSGLTKRDYLAFLQGQVRAFRRCQDASGAIVDPVERMEWQYSTPCYALSVALLAATGFDRDAGLLDSGVRAMQAAVDQMHEYRTAHNHGEFFIQPVMLALDLYRGLVPAERLVGWRRKLGEIDPYRLYPDNLRRKKTCYNHNVVALAGEYLRIRYAPGDDTGTGSARAQIPATGPALSAAACFLEPHLAHQMQYFNGFGMYRDPNVPIVYDEFSRQFLASTLAEGYDGPHAAALRDRLWRGAWTSLFMLSPFGECPTGGRSAQHIWNEAQLAVTYEIYAHQYARHGRTAEAGAFKRAARLALSCARRWLRPDGTGYVVKNRFPIEARHGYEGYSAHTQYNLLACWLFAVAYLYADDTIREGVCPADIGGYAVPIVEDFHKVFANAAGTYVEYETNGDLHYNPTGLIRCHIRGANPQLGPSDGLVHRFDRRRKLDLGGQNVAVGPAWQDAEGTWHRLADYARADRPRVEVLHEARDCVRFRVTYDRPGPGADRVIQTLSLDRDGLTVEDRIDTSGTGAVRVYFPMLIFDGLEETDVELAGAAVRLRLRGGAIRFRVLEPEGIELHRTGEVCEHRNGLAEPVWGQSARPRIVYRIERG